MSIQQLRKKHGLTQIDLAKKINIAPNTLSQYENGRRRLDSDTAKQIADIFEVSLDDVYGYTPHEDAKKNALPPEGNSAKIARIMELLEEQPESVQTMVLGLLEAAPPEDKEANPK